MNRFVCRSRSCPNSSHLWGTQDARRGSVTGCGERRAARLEQKDLGNQVHPQKCSAGLHKNILLSRHIRRGARAQRAAPRPTRQNRRTRCGPRRRAHELGRSTWRVGRGLTLVRLDRAAAHSLGEGQKLEHPATRIPENPGHSTTPWAAIAFGSSAKLTN
jgi:hypothetical protein